jgi:hypothetical protein
MHEIDAKDLYPNDPEDIHEIGQHGHGGIEKAYKNYLERLFNMHEDVQLFLQKLPHQWGIGNIHDKLEMPKEWYSKMHAIAYPNIRGHYEVTEEMVHLRVELLLVKTLLVYERLNRFYT